MGDQAELPVVKTEVKQEFGTVWIEDVNGVSRMVRVLQVTPTKALAAGSGRPAAGSGVVRAIVNTSGTGQPTVRAAGSGSQPVIRAASSRVQTSVRASASASQPVIRASGSGTQPALRASVLVSGGQPAAQVPTVRVVQRTLQVPAPTAAAAASASSASARTESPATVVVNSPIARLQMQDRHQASLGTPGRQGSRQASYRTPTTGSGRLLLPAGGSPATPGSGCSPAAGSSTRRPGEPPDLWSDSKRRRYERNSKGLRHFSMKVCQKVREKGVTTYNEVADELVAELCPSGSAAAVAAAAAAAGTGTSPDHQYDQKNIRRRVYDALNVLMAMQIISKERKQIKWLGLPAMTPAVQEPPDCGQEEAECRQRIKEKTQQLKDLVLRQIAFKNLVERNRRLEELHGSPEPSSSVQLPFIVVNTDKKTVIDCSMSNDKTEYLFNFDDTFEIHDDIEVLQRMGMALGLENGTSTEEDLEKAKGMLPASLASFVDQVAREGAEANAEGADAVHDAPPLSGADLPGDPLQNLLDAEL